MNRRAFLFGGCATAVLALTPAIAATEIVSALETTPWAWVTKRNSAGKAIQWTVQYAIIPKDEESAAKLEAWAKRRDLPAVEDE